MKLSNVMNDLSTKSVQTQPPVIKFGIGKRLILAFSIVALMTVFVSGLSWYRLDQLNKAQDRLANYNVPAISAALKLSEKITSLTAMAPLLKSAQTSEERDHHFQTLNKTLQNAVDYLSSLGTLMDEQTSIQALQESLAKFPLQINRLNEIGVTNSDLIATRHTLEATLPSFREKVENEIKPLLFTIKLAVMDADGNMQSHFELHRGLLEFKSATNLLTGLLIEGSQATSIKEVEAIETRFLSSLGVMAKPLGDLQKTTKVPGLEGRFKDLLKIGSKGDLSENIFALRKEELKGQDEAEEIMSVTRALASSLSEQTSQLVSGVEQSIALSIEKNKSSAQKTRIVLIIITVSALLISALIGWLYVDKNLIRRLMVLVSTMETIASGDLSPRINRNGNDEISKMGYALAELRSVSREAVELKAKQEAKREKTALEKKDSALALANQFDSSVGQSITVLSTSASDMRSQATEMFDVANKSIEEVQVINNASETMSKDISTVASATEELSSSVSQISHLVEKSQQIATQAVDRAQAMNGSVTRLSDGSKKIEQVIGLINVIAEQTNLLALNATIEAARAGEAGKGFAVVASEVKNLSNQTSSAVDNIVALISEIQKEVNGAVTAASDIDNVINQIDEISSGIASAVDEQASATREISQTVTLSSDNCNEIAQRVQDVSTALTQANQLMRLVLEGATQVDQESSHLSEKVNDFLDNIRTQ
jgi:methyl-accepting chemotaxis protein